MGLGYRSPLHSWTLENEQQIDWLEIITDNFLDAPDMLRLLRELKEVFPIVPHGLEMSIGSYGSLDRDYLDQVREVAGAADAPWVSDHLCFTREGGVELGNLSPVQRTRDHARHIARKAQHVQDVLGRKFLLENITYYVEMPGDLTEAEMICEVMGNCDCGLLLDLNNAAINARNHGFCPYEFLDELPLDRVEQVHLAGNVPEEDTRRLQIDGHNAPVSDEVFLLLEYLLARQNIKGILVERDELPDDPSELLVDLRRARQTTARSGKP